MAEIRHNQGEAGGYLVGRRHSNGGIKAVNKSTGQPLEMEGGEVVITRDAVSDPQKRSFNGKMMTNRQILSEINQSGGGVAFAEGGDVPESMHFDSNAEYEYGGDTMCGCDLATKMSTREYFDDGGSVKMQAQQLSDLGSGYFQWEQREYIIARKEYNIGQIQSGYGFRAGIPADYMDKDLGGFIEDAVELVRTKMRGLYTRPDTNERGNYLSAGCYTQLIFNDRGTDQSYSAATRLYFGPYDTAEGRARFPAGQSPKGSLFIGDLVDALEEHPSYYNAYLWIREKFADPNNWVQINPQKIDVQPRSSPDKEFIVDDDLKKIILLDFLAYLDKAIVPYITGIGSITLFEYEGKLLSPDDLWDDNKNEWFRSVSASKSYSLQDVLRDAYTINLTEGSSLNLGSSKKFDTALKKMLKERPELVGQKITLLITGTHHSIISGVQQWGALSQFVVDKKTKWQDLKDIIIGDALMGYLPAIDDEDYMAKVAIDTLSSRFVECDDNTKWEGGYVLQEPTKTSSKIRDIVQRDINYGPPMKSVQVGDWKEWTTSKVPIKNEGVIANAYIHVPIQQTYSWNNTAGLSKKYVYPRHPIAKGFELVSNSFGYHKQGVRSNIIIDGEGTLTFFDYSIWDSRPNHELSQFGTSRLSNWFILDGKEGVFARKSDNFTAAFSNREGDRRRNSDPYIFGENIEDIFMLSEGAELKRKQALKEIEERAKIEAEKRRKAEEKAQAKAEAERQRKEAVRNRPYQINDQPEDLEKFSLDFAMPEAQPLLNDLAALKKLLGLAKGVKNAQVKRAILLKIRRLTEKRNEMSIRENSMNQSLDSKKLITPMGLMVYYFNQARQSPVSKMGEPCGLETPTDVPSKLDIQAYYAVRTPYFKAWFGDWEKAAETGDYTDCSLLVDQDTKEPRIMYHGVRKFDPRMQVENMGKGVSRPYGEFTAPKFPATYFGDSLDYVEFYAGMAENQYHPDPNYQGFIYSVFINMRNPIRLQGLGLYSSYKDLLAYVAFKYGIIVEPSKDLLEKLESSKKQYKVWNYVRNDFNLILALKKAGYDGIIQFGDVPTFSPEGEISGMKQAKEYLVFDANQVKSAVVKKSFYLPQFNDVRFKDGGHVRL